MESIFMALMLPKAAYNDVTALRRILSKDLELPSTPPHLTLRPTFLTEHKREVHKDLEHKLYGYGHVPVIGVGCEILEPDYLVLKVKDVPRLRELQKLVALTCEQYAYPSPGLQWRPHITIGRLKDPSEGVIAGLEHLAISFLSNRVMLYDKKSRKIDEIIL